MTSQRPLAVGHSVEASLLTTSIVIFLGICALVWVVKRHGWVWGAPYIAGGSILAVMSVAGALLLRGPIKQSGPRLIVDYPTIPLALGASILAVACAAFCVGSLVGLGPRPGPDAPIPEGLAPRSALRRERVVRYSIIGAWVAVLILVAGIGGPQALINHHQYLHYTGAKRLVSLGNLLILVAPAALGYASALEEAASRRPLMLLSLTAIFLVTFSTGSRRLGAVPALYLLGKLLAAPSRRRIAIGLPIVGVASFLLASLALTLRSHKEGGSGLGPYLGYALSNPGALFRSTEATLANILAPFGYNGFAANASPISGNAIAVSLNPLPSSLNGYYRFTPELQFFTRHPFPTLGTLANVGGLPLVAAFMFVAGVILGFAGRAIRRLTGRGVSIGSVALVAACAYFCLKASEYNLRSSSRILWYALVVALITYFLPRATARQLGQLQGSKLKPIMLRETTALRPAGGSRAAISAPAAASPQPPAEGDGTSARLASVSAARVNGKQAGEQAGEPADEQAWSNALGLD